MSFSLVGWGGEQVQAYGSGPSVKSQILNLIRSVRTVMRSKLYYWDFFKCGFYCVSVIFSSIDIHQHSCHLDEIGFWLKFLRSPSKYKFLHELFHLITLTDDFSFFFSCYGTWISIKLKEKTILVVYAKIFHIALLLKGHSSFAIHGEKSP